VPARSNLFLSDVFTWSFANVNNTSVEFYEGDGSFGAAIGAGIGAGTYSAETALQNRKPVGIVEPSETRLYDDLYVQWKHKLNNQLRHAEQPKAVSLAI
jgi:xylulokinase